MLLRTVCTIIIVFYCSNSFAQRYTLNGKIKGADTGWAFIRHRQTGKTDSGRIQNGNFTITGTAASPEFCSFGLTINGIKDYYLSLFLQSGRFGMRAAKDSLNDVSILFTGSVMEKEFQQFQRKVARINAFHYPSAKTDAELEKLARRYALKHPDSFVSAFALISYENALRQLARLYKGLLPEIKRSYFGRQIKGKLKGH